MIVLAEGDDHPVDLILLHSLSRGFRNVLDFMQYRERLRRKKIRIVSITQNFGDDPASDMAVAMLAIFDEYHSAENGKHVRRTMIANAANGFWNRQTPPLGFRTYVVPQRVERTARSSSKTLRRSISFAGSSTPTLMVTVIAPSALPVWRSSSMSETSGYAVSASVSPTSTAY